MNNEKKTIIGVIAILVVCIAVLIAVILNVSDDSEDLLNKDGINEDMISLKPPLEDNNEGLIENVNENNIERKPIE